MKTFAIKLQVILIALAVALVLIVGAWFLGRHVGVGVGSLSCQLTQATEQVKTTEKVHDAYEKIDHDTPYGGDSDARYKWLFDHARRGQ